MVEYGITMQAGGCGAMSEFEIERLILSAQEGDRSALDMLTARYYDRLLRFIRSKLGPGLESHIDVEDVAQETFARAFKSLRSFSWRGDDSFLHWLNRIAVNRINETARRANRSLIIPLVGDVPGTGPTQSSAMRRQERFDRLQEALQALSPDHRRVILLARVERLPIKEVAARIQRSPEATTQLLWRAMQNLRSQFGETDSMHLPHRVFERKDSSHGQ